MEEVEIFNKFVSLNPNKGEKYNNYYTKKDNNRGYYRIYSWFSEDLTEDYLVYSGYFFHYLNKYGMTVQFYYDIIVLGLTSIDQRPVCKYCGKPTTFKDMILGYRLFCNRSCKKFWEIQENGQYVQTEESKKKISDSLKALFSSEEGEKMKNHLSEIQKKNWADPNSIFRTAEFKEKKEKAFRELLNDPIKGKEYRLHVFEAMPPTFKKKFKNGIYHSDRLNKDLKYFSSYEERFLKLMEDDINVIDFDNVHFSITYTGIDDRSHEYFPDFLINYQGQKIIIEIKPLFLVDDETVTIKRDTAKEFCKSNNYLYITLTEKEIFLKNFNIKNYITTD